MNRKIRLCYRKIIDEKSPGAWEKFVFEDSYTEFLLQVQNFRNPGGPARFSELMQEKPAAEKLHFLVSASVVEYVKQLNGIIPDIRNTLGNVFLPFKQFRFEIIESHTKKRDEHVVAIRFCSEPISWMETIGDKLLLSVSLQHPPGECFTELLSLQPFLSIYSILNEPI